MQFIILLVIIAVVFFMFGNILTSHKHDAELSKRSTVLKHSDKRLQEEISRLRGQGKL